MTTVGNCLLNCSAGSKDDAAAPGVAGFTLVELAVVLVVVGLLMTLLLGPLVAQQQQKQIAETKRQLEEIREAVFGFAMANGRLPCPARTNTVNGAEDCTLSVGVMPWSVLGLRENDAWGHRFTYAVTPYFADPVAACTYNSAIADCTISPSQSSFSLSASGTFTINNTTVAPISVVANKIPVVFLSHGPTGHGAYLPNGTQIPGSSADEAENADGNSVFISRNYDDTPGSEFTHLLGWIPATTLTNRMVAAGRLP